jgi:hypothetical protein
VTPLIMDDHLIYAMALIVLAAANAGTPWAWNWA